MVKVEVTEIGKEGRKKEVSSMGWYEIAKSRFGIEEEKIEKMSKVQISEGGRIQLPDIGEELIVYITKDPQPVTAEKLKARGIEEALFARCRKVEDGELSLVEYDLPMSKTMVMTAAASLMRNGLDPKKESLVGKVFLIVAREWKDAPKEYREQKGKVKTYVMVYKPDLTEKFKAKELAELEEAAKDFEL
jgi:hypothetical protein